MQELPKNDNGRRDRFAQALNRHGYAFQNAVLAATDAAFQDRASRWIFEAAEFPVDLRGSGTRIDFILSTNKTPCWLLAECKRVNPAYSEWFFVKSRYIRRDQHDAFTVEHVSYEEGIFCTDGVTLISAPSGEFFHLGFDVKTDKAGDPSGSRSNAIEEAATQACRGMNGMVDYLAMNRSALAQHPSNRQIRSRTLFPVIFTTASLFTADTDLAKTDLMSGEIDRQTLNPTEVDYLFYQYHLSPGIKHSVVPCHNRGELAHILQADVIRTIPIVSAKGIMNFLKIFNANEFRMLEVPI